jgi:hypothetical protein
MNDSRSTPPELAARITAAEAALADYRRDEQGPGEPPWAMWAGRLAAALESILELCDGTGPGIAQPGGGWLSGPSR